MIGLGWLRWPSPSDAPRVSRLASAHWRAAWGKPSYRVGYRWGEDPKADARARWVAELALFGSGRSVLELGTGQGRTLRAIRDRHASVTAVGLDLCHEALRAGRAAHGFHAIEADLAHPLPIQARSVDLVVTIGVLCHLHPEARVRLMGEVARVARWGAVFVEEFGPPALLKGPRAWHPTRKATGDYLLWSIDPSDLLLALRAAHGTPFRSWPALCELPEGLKSVGATHALAVEC